MSEVRADLFSDRLGTGPAPLRGQWADKAWVNFNGTGTPAIRNSGNTSSITDNGVGDFTINFTTSQPTADYAVRNGIGQSAGSVADTTAIVTIAVASVRIQTYYLSGTTRTFSDYATTCSSIVR